jgi:hypothetical protein
LPNPTTDSNEPSDGNGKDGSGKGLHGSTKTAAKRRLVALKRILKEQQQQQQTNKSTTKSSASSATLTTTTTVVSPEIATCTNPSTTGIDIAPQVNVEKDWNLPFDQDSDLEFELDQEVLQDERQARHALQQLFQFQIKSSKITQNRYGNQFDNPRIRRIAFCKTRGLVEWVYERAIRALQSEPMRWCPKFNPIKEATVVSNDVRLKKAIPKPTLGCGGNVSVGVGCRYWRSGLDTALWIPLVTCESVVASRVSQSRQGRVGSTIVGKNCCLFQFPR